MPWYSNSHHVSHFVIFGVVFIMICKTHIVTQKPCGRQLNASVVTKVPFIFFFRQPKYLDNGLSNYHSCGTNMFHSPKQLFSFWSVLKTVLGMVVILQLVRSYRAFVTNNFIPETAITRQNGYQTA